MIVHDPNLERVELVATALGPLRDELVFVGGCAAGLLMSDPGATPIRATIDVDLEGLVRLAMRSHRCAFCRLKTGPSLGCTFSALHHSPGSRRMAHNRRGHSVVKNDIGANTGLAPRGRDQ